MEITITIKLSEEDLLKFKNKSEVETKVEENDVKTPSQYARFFDDGCHGWTHEPQQNLMFLKQRQDHANDLLRHRGYLFLNEVYEMLGIPNSRDGQIAGWIYDDEKDNFVDFDIFNTRNADFVNGMGKIALLDFNVDGNILDCKKLIR